MVITAMSHSSQPKGFTCQNIPEATKCFFPNLVTNQRPAASIYSLQSPAPQHSEAEHENQEQKGKLRRWEGTGW